MRAKEFITEQTHEDGSHSSKIGKLHPDQKSVMGKIHKVAGTADKTYDLNRVMMAIAGSDGKTMSNDCDESSWMGRNNMAAPYTQVEHDMLHHAYSHLNIPIASAVPDKSKEPDDTNKISSLKPFKGYKRK